MNFVQAFRERVDLQPGVPALIDHTFGGDRVLTFSALNRAVDGLSIRLRQARVRPGDLFLMLLEPGQEYYVHLLAALQIGAVPILHEPGWTHRQLAAWVRAALPAGCVLPRLHRADPRLLASLRRVPNKVYLDSKRARARWLRIGRIGSIEESPEDAPALVLLGHDGRRAPVVWRWTQKQLQASVELLVTTLRLKAGETDLCRTPLHLLANLRAGLTSLVPSGFGVLARTPLQRQLERFKPTRTAARFDELVHLLRKRSSTLHRIFVLDSPLSDAGRAFLAEHRAHATVELLFGTAVPIAGDDLGAGGTRPGARCVGKVFDRVQARTVPLTKPPTTPAGSAGKNEPEPGELLIRAEYLPSPRTLAGDVDTHRMVADGSPWLRTGCVGYLDKDGRSWAPDGGN